MRSNIYYILTRFFYVCVYLFAHIVINSLAFNMLYNGDRNTPISTPKTRKRKGYIATKDRKIDAIKKRISDDTEFRDKENETRLANVKKALEDPVTRARHNSDALKRMANKLNDPAKGSKYNASVADKLNDPAKRAKHNSSVANKLQDPADCRHYLLMERLFDLVYSGN